MEKFIIEAINNNYHLIKKCYLTKDIGKDFTTNLNDAFKGNSFEAINRLNAEIEDDRICNANSYKYKIVNIKDINNK